MTYTFHDLGPEASVETSTFLPDNISPESRLRLCEQTLSAGLRPYLHMGSALAVIHDDRLYRFTHRSFAAYCRQRWGLSRRHAYRLMEAVSIVKKVCPNGDIPIHESHVRELARLPEDHRADIWLAAHATLHGKRLTARHLRALVNARLAQLAPAPSAAASTPASDPDVTTSPPTLDPDSASFSPASTPLPAPSSTSPRRSFTVLPTSPRRVAQTLLEHLPPDFIPHLIDELLSHQLRPFSGDRPIIQPNRYGYIDPAYREDPTSAR